MKAATAILIHPLDGLLNLSTLQTQEFLSALSQLYKQKQLVDASTQYEYELQCPVCCAKLDYNAGIPALPSAKWIHADAAAEATTSCDSTQDSSSGHTASSLAPGNENPWDDDNGNSREHQPEHACLGMLQARAEPRDTAGGDVGEDKLFASMDQLSALLDTSKTLECLGTDLQGAAQTSSVADSRIAHGPATQEAYLQDSSFPMQQQAVSTEGHTLDSMEASTSQAHASASFAAMKCPAKRQSSENVARGIELVDDAMARAVLTSSPGRMSDPSEPRSALASSEEKSLQQTDIPDRAAAIVARIRSLLHNENILDAQQPAEADPRIEQDVGGELPEVPIVHSPGSPSWSEQGEHLDPDSENADSVSFVAKKLFSGSHEFQTVRVYAAKVDELGNQSPLHTSVGFAVTKDMIRDAAGMKAFDVELAQDGIGSPTDTQSPSLQDSGRNIDSLRNQGFGSSLGRNETPSVSLSILRASSDIEDSETFAGAFGAQRARLSVGLNRSSRDSAQGLAEAHLRQSNKGLPAVVGPIAVDDDSETDSGNDDCSDTSGVWKLPDPKRDCSLSDHSIDLSVHDSEENNDSSFTEQASNQSVGIVSSAELCSLCSSKALPPSVADTAEAGGSAFGCRASLSESEQPQYNQATGESSAADTSEFRHSWSLTSSSREPLSQNSSCSLPQYGSVRSGYDLLCSRQPNSAAIERSQAGISASTNAPLSPSARDRYKHSDEHLVDESGCRSCSYNTEDRCDYIRYVASLLPEEANPIMLHCQACTIFCPYCCMNVPQSHTHDDAHVLLFLRDRPVLGLGSASRLVRQQRAAMEVKEAIETTGGDDVELSRAYQGLVMMVLAGAAGADVGTKMSASGHSYFAESSSGNYDGSAAVDEEAAVQQPEIRRNEIWMSDSITRIGTCSLEEDTTDTMQHGSSYSQSRAGPHPGCWAVENSTGGMDDFSTSSPITITAPSPISFLTEMPILEEACRIPPHLSLESSEAGGSTTAPPSAANRDTPWLSNNSSAAVTHGSAPSTPVAVYTSPKGDKKHSPYGRIKRFIVGAVRTSCKKKSIRRRGGGKQYDHKGSVPVMKDVLHDSSLENSELNAPGESSGV